MILIALGSNRAGPWGSPSQTVVRAFQELDHYPLRLIARSRLLQTEPYGQKNQPTFVNAVGIIASHLPPQALLVRLQMIERAAGRQRLRRWGPRTLDLDILDYNGRVCRLRGGARQSLELPHPGLTDRVFVLKPLAELDDRWRHPVMRHSAARLLRLLKGPDHGQEL